MKVYFLIISLIFVSTCNYFAQPPDAVVEDIFQNHRPELERLVEMLKEDKEIVRLTGKDVFYVNGAKTEISAERFDQFKSLLETIGLKNGLHRDNEFTVRFLPFENRPFQNSEKSLVYSTEDLKPVQDSLDNLPSGKQPSVYKELAEDWYISYESW